ncbi:uncharacterized protein METZ01_LOCUS348132, partial [marine metagenome]
SGAGTGMTASRIPESGCIISLERFDDISDPESGFVDVGPAVSLTNLYERLDATKFFYPPNPTESQASIGGTVATNASGARSYKFGVTRDYVLEADITFVDGDSITLKRGLTINDPLKIGGGREICFPNIKYESPRCKNAAGYHVKPGMDWLDLFIGSDGTLGIFTRIRLKLKRNPSSFVSGIIFFKKEEECWNLVSLIKKKDFAHINPCSLEYFDKYSLIRLRKIFENIPYQAQSALFFENDVDDQIDYNPTLEAWLDLLSNSNAIEDSWISQSPNDVKRFCDFRYSIPVLLNEENSRLQRTKIGTDMAVSDQRFMDMMNYY